MKFIFTLLFTLIAPFSWAKWAPLSEAPLLSYATDIVVADYQSTGTEGDSQRALFKIVETWKGEARETIHVTGTTRQICAPVVNFSGWKKGRYLLVLRKTGDVYQPFNGNFSVVAIEDAKVNWFVDEKQLWKRGPVDLKEVKQRVGKVAAAEKAEFKKGVTKAKNEIAKGVIRYEIMGQPMRHDQKLKLQAKEKLGVEIVFLGCLGNPNQHLSRGYQKTVQDFLIQKHGQDPVMKLQETLR